MTKSRSQRRHHTERKKARTRKILKRYGSEDWLSDRRIGKFTESRWGCQCHICKNPRRLFRGKNANSLTHKELHLVDELSDHRIDEWVKPRNNAMNSKNK